MSECEPLLRALRAHEQVGGLVRIALLPGSLQSSALILVLLTLDAACPVSGVLASAFSVTGTCEPADYFRALDVSLAELQSKKTKPLNKDVTKVGLRLCYDRGFAVLTEDAVLVELPVVDRESPLCLLDRQLINRILFEQPSTQVARFRIVTAELQRILALFCALHSQLQLKIEGAHFEFSVPGELAHVRVLAHHDGHAFAVQHCASRPAFFTYGLPLLRATSKECLTHATTVDCEIDASGLWRLWTSRQGATFYAAVAAEPV